MDATPFLNKHPNLAHSFVPALRPRASHTTASCQECRNQCHPSKACMCTQYNEQTLSGPSLHSPLIDHDLPSRLLASYPCRSKDPFTEIAPLSHLPAFWGTVVRFSQNGDAGTVTSTSLCYLCLCLAGVWVSASPRYAALGRLAAWVICMCWTRVVAGMIPQIHAHAKNKVPLPLTGIFSGWLRPLVLKNL
jgi:hypothetical protein